MVTISFPDRAVQKRPLAVLLGRFSARFLRSGEHLVPEAALEGWPTRVSRSSRRAKRPMSSNWRRFEVLLPLQFNDGREVSAE